jgi:hypothetical protein
VEGRRGRWRKEEIVEEKRQKKWEKERQVDQGRAKQIDIWKKGRGR